MSDAATQKLRPRPAIVTPEQITFAACVEYGSLEEGTIRLVESLRMFGGEFSNSRFVAVTPRRGPALQEATLRRFDELGVEYVRIKPKNRYVWQPYLNKYFALREAEKRAQGDLIAWLDSDVLFLRPPSEMLLPSDVDFGACPRDKNIGTTGPGDKLEAYWAKLCGDVGLQLDDLPWVHTEADHQRVRLYWNAGIFVYRKSSKFLNIWRNSIEKVLDSTDRSSLDKVFWLDQIALGLAAVISRLRLENFRGSLNYGIATHFKSHLTEEGLVQAKLLHYHDSMKPENWDWFMSSISGPLPDVHAWLLKKGPSVEKPDASRDLVRNAYRMARQVRRRVWSWSHGGGLLGV